MSTSSIKLLLVVCVLYTFLRSNNANQTPSESHENTMLDKYFEKISLAKNLRSRLHDELNVLNQIESKASGKVGLKILSHSLEKNFDRLDALLDEFLPNDRNDLTNEFSEVVDKRDMKPKRYEWLKNNNIYNKIPVIRTGK